VDEQQPEQQPEEKPEEKPTRVQWWRIALLVLLFVVPLAVAKLTGFDEWLDVDRIRELMARAGALGFLAFLVLFAIGELLHVPGWVFVGAASIAYGQGPGFAASYAGALVSVSISFFVVRAVGGQPLGAIKRPFLRRILARLESHPIGTVVILRLLLVLTPALNYALAMSKVRYREYLIGSAVGLVAPVALFVFFFDWLSQFL
jgi:uncharacterized membrane protein YdjX (TVP38/TMEM64 family)